MTVVRSRDQNATADRGASEELASDFGRYLGAHTVAAVLSAHTAVNAASDVTEYSRRELADILANT